MNDIQKPKGDNGVPKWLAIGGHVIALLLVVLIVDGLSGVVVDALCKRGLFMSSNQ